MKPIASKSRWSSSDRPHHELLQSFDTVLEHGVCPLKYRSVETEISGRNGNAQDQYSSGNKIVVAARCPLSSAASVMIHSLMFLAVR